MKTKNILLLMLVAFAIVTTGASAATLNLYAKYEVQPAAYPWPYNSHGGAPHGTLTYDIKNTSFVGEFHATQLANGAYNLIYYKDPWPGTGSVVIASGTASGGNLDIIGISTSTGDIPALGDPHSPHGGKIWLVKAADFSVDHMVAWNPRSYLFEEEGGLNYVAGTLPVAGVIAGYQTLTSAGAVTIPIYVNVSSGDVGSLQLEINYSYGVGAGTISSVGVANAIPGLEYSINNTNKKITIAFASGSELVGNTKIADVTANVATTDPAAYFGLTLNGTATNLADPNTVINTAVDNGGILILAPGSTVNIVGDANDDGYIDSADALLYLKKAAGQTVTGIFNDVALCDSKITAADALVVLKASVITPTPILTSCGIVP
mgnify:CR=1 FL=1